MSMGLTSAFTPGVINIPKETNMSNKAKKNITTGLIIGGAAAGAKQISKATFGKSFVWNTKMNKALKNFVKNAKLPEKLTGLATKTKVGGFINKVATSGLDFAKNIAGKLAKTTGRQKLLGALAVGTIALVMAAREHFSKKEGADAQKATDAKITQNALNTANKINFKELQKKDAIIDALKLDNELKDVEITSQKDTIDRIEKAAEKLGVANDLEKELHNPSDEK